MKILSIYWGFSPGGVANYAANIEAIGRDSRIELISLCILPNGREVDSTSLSRMDARIVPVRSPLDILWVKRVRDLIRRECPDCVLSHGFNGHFVSLVGGAWMRSGPSRLALYHGPYHPNTNAKKVLAPVYNGFTNWFLKRKATAVASVARFCADALVEKNNIPRTKFTVIHNGIPDVRVGDEARVRLRREWGYSEGDILVGTISRLETIKGIDYLIRAFAPAAQRNASLRLVIVGDGTQKESLRKQAELLGVSAKVRFTGMRNDAPECLAAMDIFTLPSLSEAHSIGLLEAMRAGKAIIATDVGGNTESVRHRREAIVVPAENSKAIETALDELSGADALRSELGAAARERFVNEFTDSAMREKTISWLTAACGG